MNDYDKKTNSTGFRRKLKKFTEAIKSLRNLDKIPGKPKQLKSTATQKEKEAHAKLLSMIPDRGTIRWFCIPYGAESDRRQSAPKIEEASTPEATA
jgi:hypothetical protein